MDIIILILIVIVIIFSALTKVVFDTIPLYFFIYLVTVMLIYLTSLDPIFRPPSIIILGVMNLLYIKYDN